MQVPLKFRFIRQSEVGADHMLGRACSKSRQDRWPGTEPVIEKGTRQRAHLVITAPEEGREESEMDSAVGALRRLNPILP